MVKMKHVQSVSKGPKLASAPVDIQFLIDILTAIITKKQAT